MMVDRSGLLPELRDFLERQDLLPQRSIFEVSPEEQRAASEADLPDLWGEKQGCEAIEELSYASHGHTIRARLYRPRAADGTILFIHGGGWVVGSLDTHDGSARALANAAAANVLSIEYRKGPEHPFPAAVADVNTALDWLRADGAHMGLDTSRIILCGESAGGTLAAVLARHARDRGIPLAGAALVYPPTDTAMGSTSYRDFASGYYLLADAMVWFYGHYLPPEHAAHPDASPVRATDLAGLPPTYIATAEFDPLRDEGRDYASRLIAAGNDVTYREIKGGVHGLWLMNALGPATAEMIGGVADWCRSIWRRPLLGLNMPASKQGESGADRARGVEAAAAVRAAGASPNLHRHR
jgi:acetyl esterase